MPRSSSGLGRRPLTAVTRVQIPYGVQEENLRSGSPGRRLSRSGLPGRYLVSMLWLLPSFLSGRARQTGSSVIDALSVPVAASSLFSTIPLLAVPALFLTTLGGGLFGSSMYEGSSVGGSSGGSSSYQLSDTFPDPDARPGLGTYRSAGTNWTLRMSRRRWSLRTWTSRIVPRRAS